MALILVVDDRSVNREFLMAVLGYAGHDVHEARDGRQALEVAERINPDLIITDILMPTMDGIEFTRKLSANRELCCIPVIFYTATYRVSEARVLAADCGVTTVIAKPSDPQHLLDAVHGELGITAMEFVSEELTALTGTHKALAVDRLCSTSVGELTGLQERLREVVEIDDSPSGRARQLQQISTHLDSSLRRAQALSMRLAALVELGLELAKHREPDAMLELFCRAARDIMNARLAVLCILSEDGAIAHFACWGMALEQAKAMQVKLDPTSGIFEELLRTDVVQRHSGLSGRLAALGLPSAHPDVDSILAVSLRSAARTYGWFYVADHVGASTFSEEDAQLIETLVAQIVPIYEGLSLYDTLKRNAAILEIEIDDRKQAMAELRSSETRFRQLAENIREVFFLIEAGTGRLLYISPAYEDVWERTTESLYAAPQSWIDAVHPDDRDIVLRHFVDGRSSGNFRLKYRIQCRSGIRWIKAQSFPVYDAEGRVERIAGVAEDITESELQERSIRSLSRIHAVLSGINSAIVRIRERGELLDEACRIAVSHGQFPLAWIGLFQPHSSRIEFVAYRGVDQKGAAELSGALVDACVSRQGLAHEVRESGTHRVLNDIASFEVRDRVLRLALADGYRSAIALPLLPDGVPAGAIVLLSKEAQAFDAQEIKLLDELAGDVGFALEHISRVERLNYLAYYDALTDLPNTELFHERVGKAIAQNSKTSIAVFLVDIDHFTYLNDTYGRQVGDQVLKAVGKRLKQTIEANGTVARVGADTFAVAVALPKNAADSGRILQEFALAPFAQAFDLAGQRLRLSVRVGVAVHPADGNDQHALFKNAEAALKEAKATGARYLYYSSGLNARVAEQLALEQRLHDAVRNGEFLLHYQPKVESTHKHIVGLEALVRWNSASDGLVSPARFIPLLESSGMIGEVGRWVLDRALGDYQQWMARGIRPPRVAVNVSPVQLRDPDFSAMVLGALDRHRCDGSVLELEITESVIMADVEPTIETLRTLADRGITIAVDDFGTGYSSLRYLAKLPVHALKIDRSFIVTMTADADSMALVSSIVSLAHSLGLQVVAEGVDSPEQAKFLQLMRCDVMQGFLFGRPQQESDIAQLLERQARDDSLG